VPVTEESTLRPRAKLCSALEACPPPLVARNTGLPDQPAPPAVNSGRAAATPADISISWETARIRAETPVSARCAFSKSFMNSMLA
jgi:hypothetical protein